MTPKSNCSVYNPTFNFYRYLDSNHPNKPKVDILGSCSDYKVLMHIFFLHSITLYHTVSYTLREFVTCWPTLLIHSPSGRHPTIDRSARHLLEACILPMDLDWHATYLDEQVFGIQSDQIGFKLDNQIKTNKV